MKKFIISMLFSVCFVGLSFSADNDVGVDDVQKTEIQKNFGVDVAVDFDFVITADFRINLSEQTKEINIMKLSQMKEVSKKFKKEMSRIPNVENGSSGGLAYRNGDI